MAKKTKLLLIALILIFVMVGSSYKNASADPCNIQDPNAPIPVTCP